ncbi:MAG: P-loop NTPase [Deltaproteobacteria bacterium]|nr:P-loop NTPase [Deltaproteobacteria bacterium]
MSTREKVEKALDEIRPILRADGGDLELVEIDGKIVRVRLQGACSGCASAGATLRNVVEDKIREHCPEIERVEEVGQSTGRGAPSRLRDRDPFDTQAPLPGVQSVVAVASGKGGVGKSTVAVNLALALGHQGLRTGLLDADVYGPSIPTMLGTTELPKLGPGGVQPVEKHGLQLMSIGFYVDKDSPVIWRGPMVMKALHQLMCDAKWNDLDCLVVDLPPGTGDAQLTVVQTVPVTGAVVVTTPSDVALIDARRAAGMFDRVGVPVIGILENMSYFVCPHCGKETAVFSRGGGEQTARDLHVPFLGAIPLDPAIGGGGDRGEPVMAEPQTGPQAKVFFEIAKKVAGFLELSGGRRRAVAH